MRYRRFTLTFSFMMLSEAFYVVYRPQAEEDCANGVCIPKKLHRQCQIVWISAVLMGFFVILASAPITMTLAG
ncbi:MAG: hypothetical protein FVQ83_13270 [Chloroflexi bacterium]|nr:hypothetical protein [Chloroflexota bacterium]